ncbi:MAG TPA: mannosyltransferase family protein, partial [Acidimicrobiales bacterium]|nr:mannosyltransferase family protein [Acidimicrobiales bacterium]
MTAVRLRRAAADGRGFAIALFAVLTVFVYVDGRLSMALLDYVPSTEQLPIPAWLEAYSRFDSGWYHSIAENGYFYAGRDRQSSVAFFPAYPAAMRVVGTLLFGQLAVGGIVVTLLSGLGAAVLFFRWVSAFLGTATARLGLALLLCYPFAFYLFGVIYSDALFLLAVLGAFCLLERDRPVLAALVGVVATAGRPVGVALVVGLFVRGLEIHGVLPGSKPAALVAGHAAPSDPIRVPGGARVPLLPTRPALRELRARDFAPALSLLGLAAFAALLWVRFGDPLAFSKVSSAPGWGKAFDVESLLKLHLFRLL